jgi:hypothetical protein
MTEILGRPVAADEQLDDTDAEKVITRLDAYIRKNTPPGEQGRPAA